MAENYTFQKTTNGLDDLLVSIMDAESGDIPHSSRQVFMAMRMLAPGFYEAMDRLKANDKNDTADCNLAMVRGVAVLLSGIIIPSVKEEVDMVQVGNLMCAMFTDVARNSFKEAKAARLAGNL